MIIDTEKMHTANALYEALGKMSDKEINERFKDLSRSRRRKLIAIAKKLRKRGKKNEQ